MSFIYGGAFVKEFGMHYLLVKWSFKARCIYIHVDHVLNEG